MDYKNTLNLPHTDFPMKADLVTREPARLKKWETAGLYARIQAERSGAEKFVLHDGPPFANGNVHIGTALNKILKDIIIKYKTLRGSRSPRTCARRAIPPPTPRPSARRARPTRASSSTSSARSSSASACSETGII